VLLEIAIDQLKLLRTVTNSQEIFGSGIADSGDGAMINNSSTIHLQLHASIQKCSDMVNIQPGVSAKHSLVNYSDNPGIHSSCSFASIRTASN
jgi:hypothetical protein